jgi:outer membrane receptor protein involved in Fe transport
MRELLFIVLLVLNISAYAQTKKYRLYDADTQEPLSGATIQAGSQIIKSSNDGSFIVSSQINDVEISYAGYQTKKITLSENSSAISLEKNNRPLDEIVVSANRDQIKRTQSPIAISSISAKTISDTKATTIDQLVNKVSGVFMVNLGNEQHSMGIRQPLGTRAVFMYLEDGIPIRTSGVFNHNALTEMNMAAVKNVEVIKGPSSSLYGGEAIGGAINFITQSGTAIPTARISLQANDIGYRRIDLQSGFSAGKLKMNISGYYAERSGGFLPYSDFSKFILTARADYAFSSKTNWENSFTTMNYISDMNGGVDSIQYVRKSFASQHTFTWRNTNVSRFRSALTHAWNDQAKTSVSGVIRSNTLDMNAAFRVRDDFRRQGNTFTGNKELAHGEISENKFNSYVFIAQHRQQLKKFNTVVIAGGTVDYSPNTQLANYIKIKKDTILNQYVSYENRKDSMLTDYRNNILNYAGFVNLEFNPIKNLHIVGALRYDVFQYQFDNNLAPSAFSGTADTINSFQAWAPKIGFTYALKNNRGIYANYSRGFVPPQVSELYRGVKVPDLSPSVFDNYEIGGWAAIIKDKLSFDVSLYRLEGNNTIISVRFDDGTFGNANAGKTLSQGIEMGITAYPVKALQIRFSGAYSKHEFLEYTERGVKFIGNQINSAPQFIANGEITYKPDYMKGFRLLAEWQMMSSYFMDPGNQYKYEGFHVLNLRAGYNLSHSKNRFLKGAEIWLNIINLLNTYYAVNSSRSSFGRNYTLGEPRNINVGVSYDVGNIFRK